MLKLNNTNFTLVVRQGTATNLALSTTYFSQGELAYTTDTKQLFISDGTNKIPMPMIVGNDRKTALTSAQALATLTVGGSDTSYQISANILVTTSTLHNFTATVSYTDQGNTARVLTLPFQLLAGTSVSSITNAQGTVPYEGVSLHIRAKAGTTIIVATTGTFTTVVYDFEERIIQE